MTIGSFIRCHDEVPLGLRPLSVGEVRYVIQRGPYPIRDKMDKVGYKLKVKGRPVLVPFRLGYVKEKSSGLSVVIEAPLIASAK